MKLLLLDGNSLTYRAFYALPTDMATASGQVTNAVFGFTSMFTYMVKDQLPDGVYGFHGATRSTPSGGFVTAGGRVLHIVAGGATIAEARERAYVGAERVTFEGKFYRSDIALGEVALS